MTTIGIDARLIKQTGVGVYITNLLSNLAKLDPQDLRFTVFARDQDIDSIPKSDRFTTKCANFKWHSISEQFGFYRLLDNERLDLMHFTYFSYPVRYKKKFVITIHDLIPFHFRTGEASTLGTIAYSVKHIAYKKVVHDAVKNSSLIIVPTQAVKNDIAHTFGNRYTGKIEVTYEGIREDILRLPPSNSLETRLTKPFFLYVGNFYPHKNIRKLIDAFSPFQKKYDLVLVGPNDFFAKKLDVTQETILLTDIKSEDLVFLYKNAQALIHPSLAEGFGLPLLEASYFNLPILASKIEVFKEILGNDYISFDPKNTQDIAEKIAFFIDKKPQIESLSRSNLLGKFSFRKMTQQTLDIYRKLS